MALTVSPVNRFSGFHGIHSGASKTSATKNPFVEILFVDGPPGALKFGFLGLGKTPASAEVMNGLTFENSESGCIQRINRFA